MARNGVLGGSLKTMKIRIIATCVLLPLVLSGCGYLMSGTWGDNPKNWQRAFGTTKPKDVVVVHSKYWRSAHFTMEYEYFFHIKANQPRHQQFFGSNDLMRIESTNAVSTSLNIFSGRPKWFMEKSEEKYDAWEYRQEPKGNFRIFIDKETQDIFLADIQL